MFLGLTLNAFFSSSGASAWVRGRVSARTRTGADVIVPSWFCSSCVRFTFVFHQKSICHSIGYFCEPLTPSWNQIYFHIGNTAEFLPSFSHESISKHYQYHRYNCKRCAIGYSYVSALCESLTPCWNQIHFHIGNTDEHLNLFSYDCSNNHCHKYN